jgi:hypothetical protein
MVPGLRLAVHRLRSTARCQCSERATRRAGAPPRPRSGEEFRLLIDADIKAYSDVVKAANLKFD